MVTLVIVSVLATMAIPYTQNKVKREKESLLRDHLRQVRSAIDVFHNDWRDGKLDPNAEGVSVHGFPETLEVLVEGVVSSRADGMIIRYMRRIPKDPFSIDEFSDEPTWRLHGYADDTDSTIWGSEDVYDIFSQSEDIALDGSQYDTW